MITETNTVYFFRSLFFERLVDTVSLVVSGAELLYTPVSHRLLKRPALETSLYFWNGRVGSLRFIFSRASLPLFSPTLSLSPPQSVSMPPSSTTHTGLAFSLHPPFVYLSLLPSSPHLYLHVCTSIYLPPRPSPPHRHRSPSLSTPLLSLTTPRQIIACQSGAKRPRGVDGCIRAERST